jgi:5,6-dimethylbenzimidazole synthase
MFDPTALATLLDFPEGAHPVAVLCIGPVPAFYDAPMLELEAWRLGRPLHELVSTNQWPGMDCFAQVTDTESTSVGMHAHS